MIPTGVGPEEGALVVEDEGGAGEGLGVLTRAQEVGRLDLGKETVVEVFGREGGETEVAAVRLQVQVEKDDGLLGVSGMEGLQVGQFLPGGDDANVDIGVVPGQDAALGGTGENAKEELAHGFGGFGVTGADGADGDVGGGFEGAHAFFDEVEFVLVGDQDDDLLAFPDEVLGDVGGEVDVGGADAVGA